MNLLIDPEIIISKPVKNKQYGFKIFLYKKAGNQLSIKAYSHCGKSRGILGKVLKTGEIITVKNDKVELPKITESVQKRIDTLLDLMYGKDRNKQVEFYKGLVKFNKN